MDESIFTKIIKGEIPCHKIYEDQNTIAFLDIHPVMPGHVLVVPKIQIDHLDDLPPEQYTSLFDTVKKVAKRLKEVLNAKRAVVLVMGYDIPHAHVHVLPSNSSQEFYDAVGNIKEAAHKEPDNTEMAKMAERLKFND